MSLPVTPSAWFQILHQALPHSAPALHPAVQLATFGVGDTLLIVVVALIVFGPKKLPEISRQLGKLVFEFRKASNDFKFQIEEELRSSEQAERQKQLQAQATTPQPATPVAMTATETVSAQPADEADGNSIQPPATLTSSIQPPSTGAPIESERPYGRPLSADADLPSTADTLPSPSPEEMAANAQDAVRAATPEDSGVSATDSQSAEAIPTHHG